MTSLDYAKLADLYDAYCVFDQDISSFRSMVTCSPGRVLELMAGTGRVLLPLLEEGRELVCVDRVPRMLMVLREKLRRANLTVRILCADSGCLPIRPLVPVDPLALSEILRVGHRDAATRHAAREVGLCA